MASPRITNTMRQNIVKNTIDHTFKSEREKMDSREAALALLCYNDQYNTTQRDCFTKCPELFGTSTTMHLNVRGMSVNLTHGKGVDGNSITKPVGKEHGWGNRFAPSEALAIKVYEFVSDNEELKKRVHQAEIQLMAVLESVQSFKKLRAVWPQGEKFYDMYDVDSEKAGVPSVVVSELNKVLGIK